MYTQGQTLSLRFGASSINVRISKLTQPWSLSCVMVVEVLAPLVHAGIPQLAFLKLYDRRFAPQWRSDWNLEPWTPRLEEELLEFSCSGSSEVFMRHLREDPHFADEDDEWSDVQYEACLSHELQDVFETEGTVYAKLAHHQGTLIPQLYGDVTMSIAPPNGKVGSSPELFQIPWILLEYIDGFKLSDLSKSPLDRSEWQYIADRAVQATNDVLLESDVLNLDVRPDNMMACRHENYDRGYRMVMIDFGHCRLRRDGETAEEWGLVKHQLDEEGAMGEVLKIQLRKKASFELEYKRSLRWQQYAEEGY